MLNTVSSSPSSQTEYVIYAYDFVEPSEQDRWTRVMSSGDVESVVSHAENLFQSQRYKRIEIQKKFFDERKNTRKAMTVKTYEKKAFDNYLMLLTVLLMALTSLGFFYLNMM
jgi:hypothetical protein